MLNKIRFLPVLEEQGYIIENAALVCFNGEMIMGMTLGNDVLGDGALGQQSIGRDIFALNGDGIEQGNGHLDLVGAFRFVTVFQGQGTHFFWA
jgi:hypothetical protein